MADNIETKKNRLPRSLYAETARGAVVALPLRGDKRVGVVVVGGGFTGLSTALHLAQRGADVTVLEAREPGWGASGRNGGQVNPGLKREPEEIERHFGRDLGRRMVSLSGGAPDRVFALYFESFRSDVRQTKAAQFAQPSRTVRLGFFAAPQQVGRTAERRSNCWKVKRSRARPARTVIFAARSIDGAVRSIPLAMLVGWPRRDSAGAAIHGGSTATAVERRGASLAVVTPGGTVTADWLVLATNGYTDELWPGLRQTVIPVYSGIVATEPLPQDIASRILPMGTVLYEHEDITVYYRLDVSNRLLMGGRSRLRTLESPSDFLRFDRVHEAALALYWGSSMDTWLERPTRAHFGSLPSPQ